MAQGKVYVIDDDAAMRDSLDFLLGRGRLQRAPVRIPRRLF